MTKYKLGDKVNYLYFSELKEGTIDTIICETKTSKLKETKTYSYRIEYVFDEFNTIYEEDILAEEFLGLGRTILIKEANKIMDYLESQLRPLRTFCRSLLRTKYDLYTEKQLRKQVDKLIILLKSELKE